MEIAASKTLGNAPLRPDPSSFQTADFLWLRSDAQFVAFGPADMNSGPADPEQIWHDQRRDYVARLSADPHASAAQRNLARYISQLSYEAFLHFTSDPDAHAQALAQANRTPAYAKNQFANLWVGHVALLDVRDGVAWVLDATPDRKTGNKTGPTGVAAQPYADWLLDNKHRHSHVWHGRLKGLKTDQAQAVMEQARAQVGRPYDLFNRDLLDGAAFYCSKLLWYAVFKALRLSLDDNPSAERLMWYSPLHAMRSPHLRLLYSPKDYGVLIDNPV